MAVVFDVERGDGRGPSVTVDLVTTAPVCRHTIPGVIYPAQANCDDTHDWAERCDTCEVYDTDQQAAAAVVAYYEERGISRLLGFAEPFGHDVLCPYVDAPCPVQMPAVELHDAIARLQRAGWVEVADDLLAAWVLNRMRGGYEVPDHAAEQRRRSRLQLPELRP